MIRKTFVLLACTVTISCISSCATLENRKIRAKSIRTIGEEYINKRDYTLALRELLKAEEIYSKDPFLQYDLGLAYMGKGQYPIAIDYFKKAIALKPDYSTAKNDLGVTYMANNQLDEAIACFKEVKNDLLYFTPHFPISNMGWAYYYKKDYKTAEKYFIEALMHQADFAQAYRGLGLTYMAMGNISEAIVQLEKGIKKSPDFAILYYDLAKAYEASGNIQNALNAYRKVVQLMPEDSPESEASANKIKRLTK
jgi:type IV pilus assembly protein PilF